MNLILFLGFFQHDGTSSAPTIANGGNTALTGFQSVSQMHNNAGTGGSKRMSKGNGSSVNIDFS